MQFDIQNYDKLVKGEQPFFTDLLDDLLKENPNVGIASINWHSDIFPNIHLHKERLIERFNLKYKYREIGMETVVRWQNGLQDRFDEIAPWFEHAYSLYDNGSINIDSLGKGYEREIEYTRNSNSKSGTKSEDNSNSKFRDTPTNEESVINNPTTEQSDISSTEDSSESTSDGTGTTKEKYTFNDKHVILEVNELIDKYRVLDEEFVKRFNDLFIGILTILE